MPDFLQNILDRVRWRLEPWMFAVRMRRARATDFALDLIPFFLKPGFWIWLSLYFVRLFTWSGEGRTWRSLFLGIPAIAAIVVFGVLDYSIWMARMTASDRDWLEAQRTIAAKDYVSSEKLLFRILQRGTTNLEQARFSLAVLYQDTGRPEPAELLFRALAPENAQGVAEAHRRMAMLLCEKLNQASSQQEKSRALHHLKHSQDDVTAEMMLAWGRYHFATGKLETARDQLESITFKYPEVHFAIGRISAALGETESARSSFESAKRVFSERLQTDPQNRTVRENYAGVLIRLGELDVARTVLENGLKSDPEGKWKSLLAGLWVTIHDLLAIEGGHDVGELFSPLSRSLDYDPNFAPALNRIMSYVNAKVGENVELHKILNGVVAQAKEPALAHLALGNVCWIEGDPAKARFHFEQAVQINRTLTVVLNNLAWLLAMDPQNPDAERALELVNLALQQDPENLRFLDTRGTVYMQLREWNKALPDLERSVQGTGSPMASHLKLAEVYEHLGQPEIATEHRKLADKAASAQ